jgi:hypothetical protein
MKRLTLALVAIAGIAAVAAFRAPPQQSAIAWSFVVTSTDSGWTMTCSKGCAWEKLWFKCQSTTRCKAQIGEDGVRMLP